MESSFPCLEPEGLPLPGAGVSLHEDFLEYMLHVGVLHVACLWPREEDKEFNW